MTRAAGAGPAPASATRSGPWTVLELLRWTTGHFTSIGIESARLDAEGLLAHALGMERIGLYLAFDRPVDDGQRAAFRDLVRRRARERVSVAQLLGEKEFWSLSLRVTGDVLTPRPDTETLVTAALELLPDPEAPARVLDLGTGSGAVALAIAHERPAARITATDISQSALEIARENADRLQVGERIEFIEGGLFEPVQGRQFDLIVSNPPYLGEDERSQLAPELSHEPEVALFAGSDGLAVLRPLVAGVGEMLAPGGGAAFELAPKQAVQVAGWCTEAGLLDVVVHRDLAGRHRAVTARRAAGGP